VIVVTGPPLAGELAPPGPSLAELAIMAAAQDLNLNIDGAPSEPVRPDEIPALVRAGKVSEQSWVWTEGLADWHPLHHFPGLVAIVRSSQLAAPRPGWDDPTHRPLAELIARGGPGLLADRARLEELLRHAYRDDPRSPPLLLVAHDEGVVDGLRAAPADSEQDHAALVARLVAATGMQDERAWWAVRAWAAALKEAGPGG
jgi:hypothetical protein